MISYDDVKRSEFSLFLCFFYLVQQLLGSYIVVSLLMMTFYLLGVAMSLPYRVCMYLFSRRADADAFIFGTPFNPTLAAPVEEKKTQ